MADRGMIFSAPMVKAMLAGRKTQTRRVFSHRWSVLGSSWAGPTKAHLWDGFAWDMAIARRADLLVPWEHPDEGPADEESGVYCIRPPYDVGDTIWVREGYAFGWPVEGNQPFPQCNQEHAITYRADGNRPFGGGRWQSPIHMPRWVSRITLTVTDVRVQRLQEISEEDAVAESPGIPEAIEGRPDLRWMRRGQWLMSPEYAFRDLWNSIHGPDAWEQNPWVAALTFTVGK